MLRPVKARLCRLREICDAFKRSKTTALVTLSPGTSCRCSFVRFLKPVSQLPGSGPVRPLTSSNTRVSRLPKVLQLAGRAVLLLAVKASPCILSSRRPTRADHDAGRLPVKFALPMKRVLRADRPDQLAGRVP
jgi:hypothetical protein